MSEENNNTSETPNKEWVENLSDEKLDILRKLDENGALNHRITDSQKDTHTYTTQITDAVYDRYEEKYGDTTLYWDDNERDDTERSDDAEKGFLAEAVLVDILETELGAEYVSWDGQSGEVDIVLSDPDSSETLNVEIKCRRSRTQRNGIIDTGKLDHSDVDLYIFSVMHRDDLHDRAPVSLEILGYIGKDDAMTQAIPMNKNGTAAAANIVHAENGGMMYDKSISQNGGSQSEKYEVHPRHFSSFDQFLNTVRMYDISTIIDIYQQ